MKRVLFTTLFLFSYLLGSSQINYEIKDLHIPAKDTVLQVVDHFFYKVGYSEKHEQAAWAGYFLTQEDTIITYEKRKSFKQDDLVATGSATNSDYKGSDYDRGHLVPAADMRFDIAAYMETFVYSNCSPQNPSFNRGKWRVLEEWVRNLLMTYKKIYIVTGPILVPMLTDNVKTIGKNEVTVPDFFYKAIVVYDGETYHSIAFFMPNKKIEGDLNEYIVSIDFIEAIIGIDLFPKLHDNLETMLESSQNLYIWEATKK